MLSKILRMLEGNEGLTVEEVARRLGKDPETIRPMLELLVKMGLLEERSYEGACNGCHLADVCKVNLPRLRSYSLKKPIN